MKIRSTITSIRASQLNGFYRFSPLSTPVHLLSITSLWRDDALESSQGSLFHISLCPVVCWWKACCTEWHWCLHKIKESTRMLLKYGLIFSLKNLWFRQCSKMMDKNGDCRWYRAPWSLYTESGSAIALPRNKRGAKVTPDSGLDNIICFH